MPMSTTDRRSGAMRDAKTAEIQATRAAAKSMYIREES